MEMVDPFTALDLNIFNHLIIYRVEKERNQLKSELDDLSSQLDHVSKTKVTY